MDSTYQSVTTMGLAIKVPATDAGRVVLKKGLNGAVERGRDVLKPLIKSGQPVHQGS
jgi:hypothetical protein